MGEILLNSFQNYIAKDEENVVAEALTGNFDADKLIDVLDRFGCRKVPTKENARDLILEVAHKEILQKPQYVADARLEAQTMLQVGSGTPIYVRHVSRTAGRVQQHSCQDQVENDIM